MTNRVRGEVSMEAGGESYRLCLTLGALAEIEAALELDTLAGLGERLERPRARDVLAVLAALLHGGGHALTEREVAALPVELTEVVEKIAAAFAAAGLSPQSSDAD